VQCLIRHLEPCDDVARQVGMVRLLEVLLEGLAWDLRGGLHGGSGGRGDGVGKAQVRHPTQHLEVLGVVDGGHQQALQDIRQR